MADRLGNADGSTEVHALSGQMLDVSVRDDPFLASFIGIPEAASLVPDLTDDGRSALRSRLSDLASRAAAVDPAGLADQDQITLDMVTWQAANTVAALDARKPEYSVSPINTRSAATAVITLIPKTPLSGPDEARAFLERVSLLAGMLDAASQWLDRGVLSGRTPVHHLVRGAIRQLDDFLASGGPREAIAGIVTAPNWPGEPDWRDRLARLVTDELNPALARYRDHLAQRVLSASRPEQKCGLCWIPGGDDAYCAAAAEHTTTQMSPDELHELGLRVVAQLREEVCELGARVLGTSDFAQIRDHLRSDPALYFESAEEMMHVSEAAVQRALDVLPRWISRLPRTRLEVRPMPALEAERAAVGYYRPGDPELGHPGVFWLNTCAPTSRSRFELPALCAHESVPGHHVQWSLAREAVDQPPYRRYAVPTSFIEGWALYCERLAAEMGLYTDDLDLLGLWSLQSWRAARLVIDTGIHAKGWSRQQGIEYLRDHSATPERNIVSEVDRYIGNAGQALAYMVGGLEFAGLRRLAQDRLGAAFDAPEFHARLLENGAMPLTTLRGAVERWLDGTGAKQR